MLLLRWTLEVRSLPERLMEWLLLFVPPRLFETTLQQFGFDAKRYALYTCAAVVIVVLGSIGYVGLYRGLRNQALACIGIGFWLFMMLVVMPLSSAGVFATSLVGNGTATSILGYLAIGLSLAIVLIGCRTWLLPLTSGTLRPPGMSRRAALVLVGSGVAAYAATYVAGLLVSVWRSATAVKSLDLQPPPLAGSIDTPDPHAQVALSSALSAPPATQAASTSVPVGAAREELSEPAPIPGLARDKDGAVQPAGRKKGELAPALTSNADFYVVTKNPVADPLISTRDWRLLVEGEVEQPLQVDYTMLRGLPAVEVTATLECISNFVGKPELAPFGAELVSTAVWKGVRVRDILALAGGPKPGAGWVSVVAADEFTTAVPLAAVMSPETLLVYQMNGEVLPREHGYPARLLVPGRYGLKSPKWVVGFRLVQHEFLDWYGQRNWSRDSVVKTMSRIDVPINGALLAAGPQPIAGIAFAGSRGIARVEYSADSGATWHNAELLEAGSPNQAVRWQARFELEPHTSTSLVARATDRAGNLQVEAFSLPQPDGGTGWPSLVVHAV
jgi:DMSO/TMAO reductase YedYZ molybdopterin-dependent catalytic subunit